MRNYEAFQSSDSELPKSHSPYMRVVNAVLAQAADDIRYLRERLKERRYPMSHMVDAAMWAASDEDREFSFAWCCTMVGRDPGVTRKKMLGPINVETLKEAMKP